MTEMHEQSSGGGSVHERARRGRLRSALAHATLLEIVALVGALTAVVLFALLASAVLREELAAFNNNVLAAIHTHANPTLDRIALSVTWLGSFEAAVIGGLVLGFVLIRAGRRIDAWIMAAVLVGGGILSQTLKAIFGQSRPEVFEPLYRAAGLSFPSGHSLISYCLWGFIATWLVSTSMRPALKWSGAVFCIMIATAVAFSRLYIGVHWPSDIAGGMLVATFWLAICFLIRSYVRRRIARHAIHQ